MVLVAAATLGLVVSMVLILIRALLGPTVYDRILSVNTFGTVIVMMIAVGGYLMGRPEFLDISIAYAMINFLGTVAVLKFFEKGTLGAVHDFSSGRSPDSEADD